MKNIFLIIALLTANILFAQTWVEFTSSNPQAPNIQLLNSDNSSVSFQVEVYGMYSENIVEQGTTYQRLSIPSCGTTGELGNPEMPVVRKLIAIPNCQDVSISVAVTSQTILSDYYVYPVPELVEVQFPDGTNGLQEQFYINSAAYSVGDYYTEVNAEINTIGFLRDQRIAEVFVYPVLFNPITEQLDIVTDMTITLTFTNATSDINVNTGIFNNVAANTILNYNSSGIKATINDRPGHNGTVNWVTLTNPNQASTIEGDYLIITDELFWDPTNPDSEVKRIADHRAEYNGFDVAIVRVDEILSLLIDPQNFPYEYEKAIREFIKQVYNGENASNTYDDKLGYVLLIGDADFDNRDYGIPSSYTQNNYYFQFPSDYYYSCVTEDGLFDWIGDLYIGRLSVENTTELANFVSKIIYFEQEQTLDGWRKDLTYSNDDAYTENYTNNYNNNFIPGLIFDQNLTTVDGNIGAYLTPTVNALEGGCLTFSFLGHGTETSFGPPDYGITIEILQTNLANDYKCPFVATNACETAHFDNPFLKCLAEEITTYSDTKGFVGYLGASRWTLFSGRDNTYVH